MNEATQYVDSIKALHLEEIPDEYFEMRHAFEATARRKLIAAAHRYGEEPDKDAR